MSGDDQGTIEIQSLDGAMALLDRWIIYAQELQAENERLRRKYSSAHERCEQLREIVAEDYPPDPF